VLRKWIAANKRFGDVSNWHDVAWGYNERASLSIFAAAIWDAGGIALEEYVESKDAGATGRSRAKKYKGRCDLYGTFNAKPYILEAKICWPSLFGKTWKEGVLEKLEEAEDDAKVTATPNNETRAALLFVSPSIPRSKLERSDTLKRNFIDFLKQRTEFCSAWTFPGEARKFCWKGEEERLYPGSAVVIKPLR
jgi:hypothetical protein